MLSRRRLIILTIIASALVIAALGIWLGIMLVWRNQESITPVITTPTKVVEVEEPITKPIIVEPELQARQTDGVLVPPTESSLYPIALMIENAAFGGVRPQSGLSYAQVVYEVIVEGGITRLMAVYAGDMPKVIGPVRSARPTYLEFSSEYDALYGHAGGSPDALAAVSGLGIKDLSALGEDSRFFYRDGSKVAPHNLFTSDKLLLLARRDKQLETSTATFDSWVFQDESKADTAPSAEQFISIDFGSGPLYAVKYSYDYETNSYVRYNGGEKHLDAVNGKPITVKNVIVQIVPPATDAGGEGRVNFAVTGEGKAYIARNGQVISGTWKKADRTSRTLWYDEQGKEIALNRGNIWVEVLPETGVIDYPGVSSTTTTKNIND